MLRFPQERAVFPRFSTGQQDIPQSEQQWENEPEEANFRACLG
jgi:hypothetical protein